MALATRCPYCQTTFRVVEDQLKLRNGIVRCGSCQQIFNGSEQLLKPEDIDPAMGQAPSIEGEEARAAAQADSMDVTALEEDEQTVDEPAIEEAITEAESAPQAETLVASVIEEEVLAGSEEEEVNEDLDLILTPDSTFESRDTSEPEQELAEDLEEKDFLGWKSFELREEEGESIDLDLGAEVPEEPVVDEPEEDANSSEPKPKPEPIAMASEIEAEHEEEAYEVSLSASAMQHEQGGVDEIEEETVMANEVEPDFMKQVHRQQQFGSLGRNLMLVGILVLPLFLLLQIGGAFHNRIVTSVPSLKPTLAKVCGVMNCRTALPRQIDKIVVEHSELLAVDKNENRYALNLLLSNRSGVAQAWPNLELTLNDEDGRPVARRVFMPVDYLSNLNEKTQGVEANSEKSVRLVFELDRLKAAGYLVHVFYI